MAFTILKGMVLASLSGCFLFQLWTGEALGKVGEEFLVNRREHPARNWISMFLQGSGIMLSILLSIAVWQKG